MRKETFLEVAFFALLVGALASRLPLVVSLIGKNIADIVLVVCCVLLFPLVGLAFHRGEREKFSKVKKKEGKTRHLETTPCRPFFCGACGSSKHEFMENRGGYICSSCGGKIE